MFSTETKTYKPATVQPPKAGKTFFPATGDSGFFPSAKSNSFFNHPVQAKLSVSSPGDAHEKEADSVADKVMRMPEPPHAPVQSAIPYSERKVERKEDDEVQRKVDAGSSVQVSCKEDREETASRKLNISIQTRPLMQGNVLIGRSADGNSKEPVDRKNSTSVSSDPIQSPGRSPPLSSVSFQENLAASKGGGSELPEATRGFMESRFNADFTGVRVHTGSSAQVMTSQVQAHAFTHGNDIYFNKGKFSPESSDGKLLLAHELTHTVQQGASPANKSISAKRFTHSIGNRQIFRFPADAKAGPSGDIDLSGKSGGSTLEDDAKKYFKKTFKADVGDIVIHTDDEAAQICRSRRVPAFTQGRHICFDPSKYSPTSDEGGMLLARQVAESLKQRSVIAPAMAGRLNGPDKAKAAGPAKSPSSVTKMPGEKKGKTKADSKDKKGAKHKDAHAKHKGKPSTGSSDGPAPKSVKPKAGKSPQGPEEDPAFQRVVGKTVTTAKKQKQHDPADSKASDAQKAAPPAQGEAESKAKERKTDGIDEAGKQDKPFDAKSFKAELLKKIEEATPKTLEDVSDFKENNKVGEVKSAMTDKVSQEKRDTTGPVTDASTQPLQVNDADNKHPLPLPPTPKGAPPASVGAQDAAPKPKTDSEISLEKKSSSLDEEMKANNVTEEQLTKSNEPSFAAAVDQKRSAQKDAVERPKKFRKDETMALTQAKVGAQQESVKALGGMDAARGKNLGMVVQDQHATKQKDHLTRAGVVATIQGKYAVAESIVTKALEDSDKVSATMFDEGSEAARTEFETYVDRKMTAYKRERYSGFWGGLSWLEDKLFGMPDDVNVFYTQGRQMYIDRMDQLITRVANYVTTKLNEAKQAIKSAKTDIDNYVKTLPKDLADVGKQAASDMQDKFDNLEQSINDKKDQLIEGLAKKYVDNLKKIDDRIGEMKEANEGLVDKAIGFLKKVWQVIKDLKNLFTSILSKLASIIGVILDSPGGFFDNLGKAFSKGFNNFKDKFLDYLEQGLMDWLMTNLGIAGIEMPKSFSPMAIFTLVLQVLGLTKQHIKDRAVAILGERTVKVMETAGGLIYRVFNEGLGVLWEMIQEKLTDLKDIVWEAIKSFIKSKIIDAALMFLLSMLNPIGAFVKVCMAIYDFLMMLVRFKDRIMELLDSILKAVTDIASGAIDGAANAIEKAFAKSIPVIIGFLAALLHLNDIAAKVREIITRIREKVDKAIDFVIKKGVGVVKGIVGGAKKAVQSIKKFLGLDTPFKATDGSDHHLYYVDAGGLPQLMVASGKPSTIDQLLTRVEPQAKTSTDSKVKESYASAETRNKKIKQYEVQLESIDEKDTDGRQKVYNKLSKEMKDLAGDLGKLMAITTGAKPPKAILPAFTSGVTARGFESLYISSTTTGGETADKNDGSTIPGWNALLAHKDPADSTQTIRARDNYVKMHLLHHDLGGKASDSNLTPVKSTYNTNFYNDVESHAVADKAKKVLWVDVKVRFHPEDGSGSKAVPKIDYSAYPSSFTGKYGYIEYNPADNQWVKAAAIHEYSSGSIPIPDFSGGPRQYDMNHIGATTISSMTDGMNQMPASYADLIDLERREAHDTGRLRDYSSFENLRKRLSDREEIRGASGYQIGQDILRYLNKQKRLKFF